MQYHYTTTICSPDEQKSFSLPLGFFFWKDMGSNVDVDRAIEEKNCTENKRKRKKKRKTKETEKKRRKKRGPHTLRSRPAAVLSETKILSSPQARPWVCVAGHWSWVWCCSLAQRAVAALFHWPPWGLCLSLEERWLGREVPGKTPPCPAAAGASRSQWTAGGLHHCMYLQETEFTISA